MKPNMHLTAKQKNVEEWLLFEEALLLQNNRQQRTQYEHRERSDPVDNSICKVFYSIATSIHRSREISALLLYSPFQIHPIAFKFTLVILHFSHC